MTKKSNYLEQVKQAEVEASRKKMASATQEEINGIHDMMNLFHMAQTKLYGDNPDWQSMTIKEKTPHGWLRPQYFMAETFTTSRWKYWLDIRAGIQCGDYSFIDKPIPQISFLRNHNNVLAKQMLDLCLSNPKLSFCGQYKVYELFIDWLLYSFGNDLVKDLPSYITDEVNQFWYENFKPHLMTIYPDDYLGDLAVELNVGKGNSYFPTPMQIVECMVQMSHTSDDEEILQRYKFESVCDPCLGSGRMLMSASNYSLCLYGMDIDPFIYKISLVNGYLYVPWVVESDEKTSDYINSRREKNNA